MADKAPASILERLRAAIKLQVDSINPAIFEKIKELSGKLSSHDKEYKHHDIAKNTAARHSTHPDLARKNHSHPEYKNPNINKQLTDIEAIKKQLEVVREQLASGEHKSSDPVTINFPTHDWELVVTQRTSSDKIHRVSIIRKDN